MPGSKTDDIRVNQAVYEASAPALAPPMSAQLLVCSGTPHPTGCGRPTRVTSCRVR